MLKKDLEQRIEDLTYLVKDAYGSLSDEGLERLIRKKKARSLGHYPITLYYKCKYEFKGQKCSRSYTRKHTVKGAMDAEDAVRLAAGVYSKYGSPHWMDYPHSGKTCPHCHQGTGKLWKIRCYDIVAFVGEPDCTGCPTLTMKE